MFKTMKGLAKKAGAVVGGSLVAGAAFAQGAGGIDVSDGVAKLQEAGVAIAEVGGAMLVLAGIAAAYKWARAAFF